MSQVINCNAAYAFKIILYFSSIRSISYIVYHETVDVWRESSVGCFAFSVHRLIAMELLSLLFSRFLPMQHHTIFNWKHFGLTPRNNIKYHSSSFIDYSPLFFIPLSVFIDIVCVQRTEQIQTENTEFKISNTLVMSYHILNDNANGSDHLWHFKHIGADASAAVTVCVIVSAV